MEITSEGCILTCAFGRSKTPPNQKWTGPLHLQEFAQITSQTLMITPYSSFCEKKGYSNQQNAFPLYRRLSSTRILVPRQFFLDHVDLGSCSTFSLPVHKSGWASRDIQPLAMPLRPLQHEIVYDKVLPYLSQQCYRSPTSSEDEEPFFFGGGLIILPCGYGKTKTAEQLFYEIGKHRPNGNRLLFLCPNKELAEQTAISFRRDLKGCRVAILRASETVESKKKSSSSGGEGKGTTRQILVSAATQQISSEWTEEKEVPESVRRMIESSDVVVSLVTTLKTRKYGRSFYEYFGMVVIDEVHHMTAKGNSQLFFYMNPPILIGITAEYENNARTFSLLEQCIGPRLFEKKTRDGLDDITVYKCTFPPDVRAFLFGDESTEECRRFQELKKNPDGELDYGKTLDAILFSPTIQEYWAQIILYIVDSKPEDETYIGHLRRLRPVIAPIDNPDVCSRCNQECVFTFSLRHNPQTTFCTSCVKDIYHYHGNRWEEKTFLPDSLTCKTDQEWEDEVTGKALAPPKKARKKRKVVSGEGEEADELVSDERVAEQLEEKMAISKLIYQCTYFGINQTLVICERVQPMLQLELILRRLRPELTIGILAGDKPTDHELRLAKGKQLLLATPQRADEGMDVPTINNVMYLSPKTTIRQSMGRELRTPGPKRVFDLIYPQTMFWKQFAKDRKPEYDDHKCKFRTFRLPAFEAWKKKVGRGGEEEEEGVVDPGSSASDL
jgi:superfamily II DNA or RNA helicase